ncbi:MAG: tRNA (adenosine(37)-N6)-dimethylallyltransferase MiaA [Defluviitaleaceae bacterium]|nr:tRNA (adenosine(37)-N6)-dimethylallyltransferase MiaA [Defluviitaleaceae bacterium]
MTTDYTNKPLIVITGPTACGKTPTAVALAKMINGEVISADSMQLYRGMDIGTAKPSIEERKGIPHHLIDVVDPNESFSVAIFQKMAGETIFDIHSRGKIPILAGGTGFYINAVVHKGLLSSEMPEADDTNIRKELLQQATEKGNMFLHDRLKIVDHPSAERIHPNNIKRVVRALAYYEVNGKPISSHRPVIDTLYNTLFIVLHRDRALLYEAIDKRVEDMVIRGLVEEVEKLLHNGVNETATSMQALGYKEIIPFIKGQCTLEEAVTAIKQGSRRYAKRQLTWFRNQMNGQWLSMDDKTHEEAASIIANRHRYLRKRGCL